MAITLIELYREAENNSIEIISIDTSVTKSMSIVSGCNNCYVGINPFMLTAASDEAVCLAHELGHCMTGSFYNKYSKLDIRRKYECRADVWAIKKLIPKDELKETIEKGIDSRYELSEYFDVTEDFMQKALDYYRKDVFYECR